MSRVQDTIRQLIADRGQSVLDNPDMLLAMLEDYGAFRDENPVDREAWRGLIKAGEVRKILSSPAGTLQVAHKQKLSSDCSRDICTVVVKALIIICIIMSVISLALIVLSLLNGNTWIGEWLYVLASGVFNICLLYSFL